jgi:hypothetical protein
MHVYVWYVHARADIQIADQYRVFGCLPCCKDVCDGINLGDDCVNNPHYLATAYQLPS